MNVTSTTTTTTLAPTLSLFDSDSSNNDTLFWNNDTLVSDTDDDRSPWPWIFLVTAIVGVWCAGVCFSTRGCRDLHYRDDARDNYANDPVWAPPQRRTAEDYRLALELQRQEAAQAAEQAAQARIEWINQLFVEQQEQLTKDEDDKSKLNNNIIALTDTNLAEYQGQPCAICLSEFRAGNVVRQWALCRHVFHQACIRDALGRNKYCPVCRKVFLRQEITEDEENGAKEESESEQQAQSNECEDINEDVDDDQNRVLNDEEAADHSHQPNNENSGATTANRGQI